MCDIAPNKELTQVSTLCFGAVFFAFGAYPALVSLKSRTACDEIRGLAGTESENHTVRRKQ